MPIFLGPCIFLHQVFTGRDEVIEDVLLLQFGAGFMPGFSVLATTANAGLSEDAAFFQEDQSLDLEPGDFETLKPP